MCPNCYRGLTYPNREVCLTCAGTGIWNPQSLPINEKTMDEETVVAPAGEEVVAAPAESTEAPAEEAAPVEVAPEVAE